MFYGLGEHTFPGFFKAEHAQKISDCEAHHENASTVDIQTTQQASFAKSPKQNPKLFNEGRQMSGKGGRSNAPAKPDAGSGGKNNNASAPPEPTIVSGWQYHQYAQSSDRYAYIGKDEETGEPEFLDYGPKSSRR